MNQVALIGRLTADPEQNSTSTGKSYARFSIAVSRNFKREGEDKPDVDFIKVVTWNGTSDFVCKYFKKGTRIGVTGALHINKWTDKDGNKRTSAEISAASVDFADGKDAPASPDSGVSFDELGDDFDDEDGDELPF